MKNVKENQETSKQSRCFALASNDLLAVSPRPKQRRPRRTMRVRTGFCGDCGEPRESGATTTLCAACAENYREKAKQRRAKFAQKGVCPSCKTKHKEKTMYCAECQNRQSAKSKARQATLRAAGLCGRCTAPAVGFKHCFKCRLTGAQANRQWKQRKKEMALS